MSRRNNKSRRKSRTSLRLVRAEGPAVGLGELCKDHGAYRLRHLVARFRARTRSKGGRNAADPE